MDPSITEPDGLQALVHQPTVSLTTFRRDGTRVRTPVNLAVDGRRAYFRTWSTSGKAKRLRRDPNVAIAPCTFRGTLTGSEVAAMARPIDGEAAERARTLIERKHPLLQGILVHYGHRFTGRDTVYFEVIPG